MQPMRFHGEYESEVAIPPKDAMSEPMTSPERDGAMW